MPLIIISGYPSSGKSTRARQLLSYLDSKISSSSEPRINRLTTIHITDESLGTSRTVYQDVRAEKDARAAEMSAVKRALGKDKIVIADGLNYIKGYRYQLYCEAKAVGTPSCVIHIGTPVDRCRANNKAQLTQGGGEGYEERVFEELVFRYEEPNGMNRWDSPLFTVVEDDEDVPGEKIWEALFREEGSGKGVKPNAATVLQPASSPDYLYELDQATQNIVNGVLDWQKSHEGEVGGEIILPDVGTVELPGRTVALPQLQRLRRQFITLNRQHKLMKERIGGAFVEYLNDSWS